MVKMNEMEDKDFEPRKAYFAEGVHEVYITAMERGVSPNTKSEYIEVSLLGEGDAEGSARLYLTDKTADRSRSILATIAVHNKGTDAEKQKVRDVFKKVTDTDQLDDKFLAKFKDMQAWILVEEDKSAPKPNGGFYLRTNLYSYEPKPRAKTADELVSDITEGGEPVDLSEIPF